MPRIKVGRGQLLLTLRDGEVVDTLKEDKSFGMSFKATYVNEEDEQEDTDFLFQVKEDEQAATASRTGVSESASNRTDSEQCLRCRDAEQRLSSSCKEAEQQLVSGSEPSASQVKEPEYPEKIKEPEHPEEVKETEECREANDAKEPIMIVESCKTSELDAASSSLITEGPTLILVGESLRRERIQFGDRELIELRREAEEPYRSSIIRSGQTGSPNRKDRCCRNRMWESAFVLVWEFRSPNIGRNPAEFGQLKELSQRHEGKTLRICHRYRSSCPARRHPRGGDGPVYSTPLGNQCFDERS